jgi:putative transposase
MPRRFAAGGYIFHVHNRAVAGIRLFERYEDYAAFERLLAEACQHVPMRIVAYSLMPTHWHLVLWPYNDGDLARFMHWLTTTHVHRWREHRESVGRGHLYQGPYKSHPVQVEEYLLVLCRYVERNALTAGLVGRAEEWRWCSLWRRLHPEAMEGLPVLCEWPAGRPTDWVQCVNEPQTQKELDAVSTAVARGQPLGTDAWKAKAAASLGLERTLRPRGRPPKRAKEKDPGSFSGRHGRSAFK